MSHYNEYFKAAEEEHEKNMIAQGYTVIPVSIRHLFNYHKYLSAFQMQELRNLLKDPE